MCHRERGSFFEPPSFYPCDRVLTRLDELAVEGDPTKGQLAKVAEAIKSVHPAEEGDKYDDHPDV